MTFRETIGGSNGLGKLHSSASSGTHRSIFGVVMPLGGPTAIELALAGQSWDDPHRG